MTSVNWHCTPFGGLLYHTAYGGYGELVYIEGVILNSFNAYNSDYFIRNSPNSVPSCRRSIKSNRSKKPARGLSENVTLKRPPSTTNDKIQGKSAKIIRMASSHKIPPTEGRIIKNSDPEEKSEQSLESPSPDEETISKSIEILPQPFGPQLDPNSLEVAVIDRNHKKLTLEQVDVIKAKLVRAMDCYLFMETPPQFEKVDFQNGYLFFECANLEARSWLEKVTVTMKGIWEGADLILVDGDFVRRPQLKVIIHDVTCSISEVLKKIRYQNPGLDVPEWSVLECEKHDRNMSLTVSVDLKSFEYLESKQFKIYYLFQLLELQKE